MARSNGSAFLVLSVALFSGGLAATAQKAKLSPEEAAIESLGIQHKAIFEQIKPDAAKLDDYNEQAAATAGREDLFSPPGFRPAHCAPLPGDPVQRIVDAAKTTNIVVINEDHARPRHRAFIAEVLKALHAEGYSIYAAETFTSGPDYNNKHPGVWASDGWYLNEPMFGRTVALAKSLGYGLVNYESNDEQNGPFPKDRLGREGVAYREQAEADNLMTAIFRDHPDAKAVIHVGFSHVMEEPIRMQGEPMPWMAARLKAATGRDPLTISQTSCASPNASIVAATDLTDLAADARRPPVDLFIGYPAQTFTHGRPDWRRALGDVETPTPAKFLGRKESVIIEARPIGASLAIVPTDRILERPGETLPLLLPPGHYRIDGFTPAGRIDGDPVDVTVSK